MPRGFALLDPDRRRFISSLGGHSVPASKRAFSQSRELAIEAGRKGGKLSRKNKEPQVGKEV